MRHGEIHGNKAGAPPEALGATGQSRGRLSGVILTVLTTLLTIVLAGGGEKDIVWADRAVRDVGVLRIVEER